MIKVATEFWNYRFLESQIKNKLFQQRGSLPNNFHQTLNEENREKALKTFKNEYLFDFISIQPKDEDDERVLEQKIVNFALQVSVFNFHIFNHIPYLYLFHNIHTS